jgi:ribonucleoside-triphosphate reductase
MTEEENEVTKEGTEGSPAEVDNTDTSHMIPKQRFDEVNARMKEFEKQLKAKEEALKKAQQERLEEKEEYKTLYEKTTAELSELKPIAEQIDSWREVLDKLYEAQIADIPEEYLSLIPEDLSIEKRLNWLAKNKALIMKPIAPNIGAGQRGSGKSEVQLTPEQQQVARQFGYSDEEYKKYLDA